MPDDATFARVLQAYGPALARLVAAYEADKWVLSEVIGFLLTRGVIASADRRPPAALDELLAGPDPANPNLPEE